MGEVGGYPSSFQKASEVNSTVQCGAYQVSRSFVFDTLVAGNITPAVKTFNTILYTINTGGLSTLHRGQATIQLFSVLGRNGLRVTDMCM